MIRTSRRDFVKTSVKMMTGASLMGLYSCNSETIDLGTTPVTKKVIDTHIHVRPETLDRCLSVMDDNYIRYAINIGLSGDDLFNKFMEASKDHMDRVGTMYAFDWALIKTDPDFFKKAPDMLERAVESGALGAKMFKNLGLTVEDADDKLIPIDDPRLFPIWERAEKLNAIIAFHSTDPLAFFQPWEPANERWDEMELHPEWSFADPEKYPPKDVILSQRNNVLKNFPGVNFQCVHVANYPEDLSIVDAWMDEMPNMYLDLSARFGELGRHPSDEGKAFFLKHQDRIMFGTDMAFYADGDVQGAGPNKFFSKEEANSFYGSHWRYLQTIDKQFDHPTPIQGNWKIDGIGLDKDVLKKIYWDNALKLHNLERYI